MKATDHPIVGRRVLNVWRQCHEYAQEFRDSHKGTVMAIERGCNPIVYVRFDGRNFESPMCPGDLAFIDLWPQEGCRVNAEELA